MYVYPVSTLAVIFIVILFIRERRKEKMPHKTPPLTDEEKERLDMMTKRVEKMVEDTKEKLKDEGIWLLDDDK